MPEWAMFLILSSALSASILSGVGDKVVFDSTFVFGAEHDKVKDSFGFARDSHLSERMKRPFDGGQMITSWLTDVITDLTTDSLALAESRSDSVLRDLDRLLTPSPNSGGDQICSSGIRYAAENLGFSVERVRLLRLAVSKANEDIRHAKPEAALDELQEARKRWLTAMEEDGRDEGA